MPRRYGSPPRDQADRNPPLHNRLFILGGKEAEEEEFRSAFSKYGTVQDVWIVKNRQTGEKKGITYVTFSKTSEAALAQEETNGRVLPGHPKPLKVMLAADKEQGNMREDREDEKLLRVFVKVPKSHTEEMIQDYFKQWGDIDYCSLLKDRSTGESKGLAYVKYYRGYCAAMAVENAASEYKAVFAKKKTKDQYDSFQPMEYRTGSSSHSRSRSYGGGYGYGGGPSPMEMVTDMPHNGETRLEAMASTAASQEQVYRLFDLVPGLDFCDFDRHSGIAYIQYSHPSCAAYAKDKLNGFEYPPGFRISVRYPPADNYSSGSGYTSFGGSGHGRYNLGSGRGSYSGSGSGGDDYGRSNSGSAMGEVREITDTLSNLADNPNVRDNDVLQTLVQTMSKATSILQAQGLGTGGDGLVRTNYCNVPLPEKQAMAPKDSEVVERLFVVSQPAPFPDTLLKDAFCRFAGLIDAHFMTGRNYGYAKFTSKESANKAIETLHAQEICGNRLKVMLADPPRHQDEDSGKRLKRD